jgi:hypothetical protein
LLPEEPLLLFVLLLFEVMFFGQVLKFAFELFVAFFEGTVSFNRFDPLLEFEYGFLFFLELFLLLLGQRNEVLNFESLLFDALETGLLEGCFVGVEN